MFRSLSTKINRSISSLNSLERLNTSKNFSTIYSLSSGLNNPYLNGKTGVAIAVLRISGPKTDHLLNALTNGKFHSFKPRVAKLTNLYNAKKDNDLIDKGIAIWFPKPNSYTGEDMCELHVHGSRAVIKTILDVLNEFEDTKPADNGEFTKRAFLNKKLSLIEAEAINDLIHSEYDSQRKNALKGLDSNLLKRYEDWRERLIKLLAYIQADIEFGEDQLLDEERIDKTIKHIFKIKDEIDNFLKITSKRRHVVKDGLDCCILGRPNSGKSSLMNALCDKELSIVSPFKGTTRDIIESTLEISGYQVKLSDTAGIRNLNDSNENFVENQGIKKAVERAKTADILIHLIDLSNANARKKLLESETLFLNDESNQFLFSTSLPANESRKMIYVLNKIDLIGSELRRKLSDLFKDRKDVILISCETKENIIGLVDLIAKFIDKSLNEIDSTGKNDEFLAERHQKHLKEIVENIDLAMKNINEDRSITAFYIENSVNEIAKITGTITTEQILDIVFRDFCIGK